MFLGVLPPLVRSGRNRTPGALVEVRMRRRGIGCLAVVGALAFVVALLLAGLVSCSRSPGSGAPVSGLGEPEVLNLPAGSGSTGATTTASEVTSFPIPAYEPGKKCSFDYRAQISRLDAGTGAVHWSTDIPTSSAASGLVVHEGRVFFAADGSVGAIEIATGRPLWWRPHGDANLAVAWGDGTLLARGTEVLAGLDPETGSTLWRAGTGEVLPGPSTASAARLAAVQGRIVTRTGPTIRVLRAADGVEIAARTSPDFADGVPVLDSDLVLLAGTTSVRALRVTTLATVWEWTPALHSSAPMTATPVGDLVVVAAGDGGGAGSAMVTALDLESGDLRWQHLLDARVAAPDVAGFRGGPVLVMGELSRPWRSAGGSAEVLDVHTGMPVWRYPAARDGATRARGTLVLAAPRADSGSVVAAYDSSVRRNAIADGRRLWRTDVGFRPQSLVDEVEVAYVLGSSGETARVEDVGGRVAALGADGHILWRADVRDPALDLVRDVSGDLLVHSEDIRVFCD